MYDKSPDELRAILLASGLPVFTPAALDTIFHLIGNPAIEVITVDETTVLADARVTASSGAQLMVLHVDGPVGTEAAVTQSADMTLLMNDSGTGVSAFFRDSPRLDKGSGPLHGRAVFGSGGDDCIVVADRRLSYVDGGSGNDRIVAGDGPAYFIGGVGDDTLVGGRGDDTLVAGAGSDCIDGGGGFNIVVFPGNLDRVDIVVDHGLVRVTNSATQAVAELRHVSMLRFDDLDVLLLVPPPEVYVYG